MRTSIILLGLLMAIQSLSAQVQVRGVVIDAETREALPGVHITFTDKESVQVTDLRGEFSLEADLTDTLIFSFVSYQTLPVAAWEGFRTIELQAGIELQQVIVTASREKELKSEVPSAVSVIRGSELRELGVMNMPEAMRHITGIHVADFGNEQQSVSIRQPLSFSATQLVILEDGIPVGPTSIATSGSMKDLDIHSARSIEVIRGPASSIYGSEAVGGVINLITRMPPANLSAEASLSLDDNGFRQANVHVGKNFGKFGVIINASTAQRRDGYRIRTDFDKNFVQAKAVYMPDEKNMFTFSVTALDYYTDFAGSIDSLTFFTDDAYNYQRFTYKEDMTYRGYLRYDRYLRANSKSFIALFYRNDQSSEIPSYLIKRDYSTPFPPTYYGERVTSAYNSKGILAQHKQGLGFWDASLIGGIYLDYTPDTYTSEKLSVTRDTADVYTEFEPTGEYIQDFDATLLNTAAYLSFDAKPFPALKVIASVRYDHLGYEFDNHLPPTAQSGAPDETNSFRHLSPKIGFTWQALPGATFYGNHSVGFSPPLFSQLYKEVTVPVLEPATFRNYELGSMISALDNKLLLDLALYQVNGVNEVVRVLLPDGSEQNQSAGKTLHRGAEATLSLRPVDCLEFRYNGTYAMHRYVEFVDESRDYSGMDMPQAPRWMMNSSLTWKPRFLPGFRIAGEVQYLGPYYMDGLNSEQYEGYTLYNLRSGYTFKNLSVWVNVLNAADALFASRVSKSYYGYTTVCSYSPGYHRTIQAGVSYRFEKTRRNP